MTIFSFRKPRRSRKEIPPVTKPSSKTWVTSRIAPVAGRMPALHCLVAFLVVLTVSLLLCFDYRVQGIYRGHLEENQVFSNLLSDLAQIRALVTALGDSGYDASHLLDAKAKSQAARAALSQITGRLDAFGQKAKRSLPAVLEASTMQKLDLVEQNLRTMAGSIEEALVRRQENQPVMAEEKIAAAANQEVRIYGALASIREEIFASRVAQFKQRETRAASLQTIENLLGCFLILTVAGATLYGFKIETRAQREESEKIRYMERLVESERKYRDLFENAVGGVFQSAPDMTLLSANPAVAKIFGYSSPEEVLKENSRIGGIFSLWDPELRAEYQRLMNRDGQVNGCEIQAKRKDGTVIWVAINARAVSDEAGKLIRHEGFLTDITAQKQAELALKQSEDRFRDITENLNQVFWIATPDCAHMFYVSLAYEKIWGRSRQSLLENSMSFTQPIVSEDREPFLASFRNWIAQADSDKKENLFEFRILTPDGSVRWIESHVVPVRREDGQIARMIGFARDITSRKRAENDLRASEERFKLALAAARTGVFECDLQTNAVYWSPECYEIFGIESFGGTMEAFVSFIHPEDAGRLTAAIKRMVVERTMHRDEFRFIRPDGKVRWQSVFARCTYDSGGRPLRAVGAVQDITKRKEAEEALRESERKFREIIVYLDEGYYSATPDGVLLEHNQALSCILGFDKAADLRGRRLPDFWQNPDERTDYQQKLTAEGSVSNYRIKAKAKTGEKLILTASAHLVKDKDGHPLRIEGVLLDVSERERVEEALRQSEARLNQFVEKIDDIIYAIDLEGNFTALNRAGEEIVGPREKVGNVFRILPPEYVDLMRQSIIRVAQGEEIPKIELEVFGADGSRVTLEASTRLITKDGIPAGIDGIARNITQRKQAEQMKSDFVSFVTHQLRTPLAGIKWQLELASEEEGVPGDVLGYVRDAHLSADRLTRLVNDLLNVSRLEQGKLAVLPVEVDLPALSKSVVEELTPLIRDKKLNLTILDGKSLSALTTDSQLLRQVILNLVSNAIKYTPPEGAISIDFSEDGERIRWRIHDNGIGVSQETRVKLFQKFYRAPNAGAVETEGTGLGLYIVRLIVERLGGRVWCDSEEGAGSTFAFTLPLADRGGVS